MASDRRQAVLALFLLAVLVGSLAAGWQFVSLAAPVSGGAWATTGDANPGSVANVAARAATGPRTIENPYGHAEVRYDDHGVPHITAENERALYFAVGYVQARDRLFQMDLQRRLMAGNLSAAFGERAVDSDRFHRKMGFEDAANASWRAMEGTDAAAGVRAFSEGVNTYIETRPLPMEFRLNGYEPTRWTPTDTMLVGKLIAWSLTGDFRDLEQRVVERRLPNATRLYPRQLRHDSTIVGRALPSEPRPTDDDGGGSSGGGLPMARLARPAGGTAQATGPAAGGQPAGAGAAAGGDFRPLYESLRVHEPAPVLGSNSWVVSGNLTASGRPLLANDPHLQLTVPPVWYEMHVRTEGMDVRGVAFPGVPTVVIGGNDEVAWGFTNVGADVTDLYTYVRPGDDTYLYEGEVREVQRHTETIQVKGGPDREVAVERTVHGPLLEREGEEVAVAWTGLTGTREATAVYRLNHAGSIDEVRAALRTFDSPTQNIVAMDRDGGTLYRITGQYPVRTVDGSVVPGDRVFNGSAGHGEWRGFTPYGQSSWDGFVNFLGLPELRDANYVATANQRVADDPGFYIATSTRYADPYRGARIYERIEARVESGRPVTRAFVRDLQQDRRSLAAEQLVPDVLDARSVMDAETRAAADRLEGWEYNLTADSRAALLYALFRERYRNATFGDEFRPAGLGAGDYPHFYTLGRLPANSEWFDDERTPERETRADIAARAFRQALAEADREGYETYGDYNRLELTHPFPVDALDYPTRAMGGGPFTVYNFRSARDTQAGSSLRLVAGANGSLGVIPGGQSGNYFSPHYSDQLGAWARGEYRSVNRTVEGRTVLVFREGDT